MHSWDPPDSPATVSTNNKNLQDFRIQHAMSVTQQFDPRLVQRMAGSSENNRKKPRRWVLRSPGRKSKMKFTDSDQQEKGPKDNSETGDGPSAKYERLESASSVASTGSTAGFFPPAGPSSSSRSPLSRLRTKVIVPSPRMMAKILRRGSPDQRAGGTTKKGQEQRSSAEGAFGSSSDTTSHHFKLDIPSGGQETKAVEDALAREEISTTRKCSTPLSRDTCDSGRCDQDKVLDVGAHPAGDVKGQTSRGHNKLSKGGGYAVSATSIKTGQQLPQITFIGVFLNGVAVALASFVPSGGADARIALVKSVRMFHWETDDPPCATETEFTQHREGKTLRSSNHNFFRQGRCK